MKWNMKIIDAVSTVNGTDVMNRVASIFFLNVVFKEEGTHSRKKVKVQQEICSILPHQIEGRNEHAPFRLSVDFVTLVVLFPSNSHNYHHNGRLSRDRWSIDFARQAQNPTKSKLSVGENDRKHSTRSQYFSINEEMFRYGKRSIPRISTVVFPFFNLDSTQQAVQCLHNPSRITTSQKTARRIGSVTYD